MASKSEMVEFILDRELPQADDIFHDAVDEIKDKNPEKPITDPDLLQNAWALYKIRATNIHSAKIDKKSHHIDSHKEFVDLLSQWIAKEEYYYKLSESNLIEAYRKFIRLDGKMQPSHILKVRDQRSFYHDPSSDANFDDYENMAFFTLEESIALSFDKNPLVVNTRKMSQLPDKLPFVRAFKKRLRLLSRDIEKRRLDKKIDPLSLLQWFEENQIPISDPFRSLLKNNSQKQKIPLGTSASMKEELELLRKKVELHDPINNPSSKRSAYMLILGMAIAKFNHVPKEMRKNMQISGTSKANSISGALGNYGFNITDETVLSWLEEAYAALDDIKIVIPTK